jgi:stage II sporulation protein AA (anti-sigma F factor antagonist)
VYCERQPRLPSSCRGARRTGATATAYAARRGPPSSSTQAARRSLEEPSIAQRRVTEPDPFRVDVDRDGDLLRIVLAGELDLGNIDQVAPALRGDGVRRRLLDLRELTFMDSSGLQLILAAHAAARREGWALQIVPGPPAVQRVFEICGVCDELPFVAP